MVSPVVEGSFLRKRKAGASMSGIRIMGKISARLRMIVFLRDVAIKG